MTAPAPLLAAVLLLVACSSSASAPDARTCTADCECTAIGDVCRYGECVRRPGVPEGICSIDGGGPMPCPCLGGSCDDRGCCVLPDGAIDNGSGPACRP